jgi:hypothetical protein
VIRRLWVDGSRRDFRHFRDSWGAVKPYASGAHIHNAVEASATRQEIAETVFISAGLRPEHEVLVALRTVVMQYVKAMLHHPHFRTCSGGKRECALHRPYTHLTDLTSD